MSLRIALSLLVGMMFLGQAQAQTADLTEGPLAENFFRVTIAMKLEGKTKVQQDGQFVVQALTATAEHDFLEKVLDEKKLEEGGAVAEKCVRIYKKAQADIKLDGRTSTKTFRADRTFLVAQRREQATLTYCPDGSLTRDEIDLTEHFNTLALTGLLPGKKVEVGASWKVSPEAAQVLCGVEGLVSTDLACKLEKVAGNVAHVSVSGTASGIELGCAVKILVAAGSHFEFDLDKKRLVTLEWKQTDERDQGPANPGLSADVTILVQRKTIEEPQELNTVYVGARVPVGKTPPPELTRVLSIDPQKRFEIQHGRDWILTSQTKTHTVLRLMKQGALVAQATLTPFPRMAAGEMMPFEQFVGHLKNTPTWEEEGTISQDEKVDMPGGRKAYRYAATGKLDGRDVVQYFYLIAGAQGEHVVVTFTMNPTQAKDLGVRDLDFVRSVSFPNAE